MIGFRKLAMETWAAVCSATCWNARAAGESGSAMTSGCPSSPPRQFQHLIQRLAVRHEIGPHQPLADLRDAAGRHADKSRDAFIAVITQPVRVAHDDQNQVQRQLLRPAPPAEPATH
jgi:hypothetical protein